MDHKELYGESRRLVNQARELLDQYKDKEMPADVAAQFDTLMAASDKAKADADRRVSVLEQDAALQAAAGKLQVQGPGGTATFEGFEEYEDRLPAELRGAAFRLAQPDAMLGVGNATQVKATAAELYPAKAYGNLDYGALRWKHATAFGKWVRWGTAVLDPLERKIGFGGRIVLTPGQIATALASGLTPAQLKDLVEGSDTAGGFLVPEDFRAEVVRGLPTAVVVRPRARVVATSRDVVKAPKITGNTNTYSSAVRLTWGSETPAATSHETNPTFGQSAIPVHTAMASTQLSMDLLEDAATDVSGLLRDLYVEAFALGEDDAFLTGDGNGKPQGICETGSNGVSTVNTGDASSVTADGLIDLMYDLPPQYWTNAIWTMNATSAGKAIRKLKDTNDDYLWQRGLAAGEPDILLGKEIAYSQFMANLAASSKSIAFGDFRYYWIADRVGMTLQRLDQVYAEQNMVGFVARKRVGGQVVLPAAFRVQNTSAS